VFDVPFAQAGRYQYEITVDGGMQTTLPITVAQTQATPPPSS